METKKTPIILVILLFVTLGGFSQVRHIKGIKGIESSFGVTGFGSYAELGAMKYFSSKTYGKINVFHDFGEISGIQYMSSGLQIGYVYNLFMLGEGVYFNAIGGLVGSIDSIKKSEYLEVGTTFKPGSFIGVEIEAFLSDNLVIIASPRQKLLLGEEFGLNRYALTLGIRFHIN